MVRKTRRGGLIRNNQLTPNKKEYRIIAVNSLTDKALGVQESLSDLNEAKNLADQIAEQKNIRCYILDGGNRSVYRTKD